MVRYFPAYERLPVLVFKAILLEGKLNSQQINFIIKCYFRKSYKLNYMGKKKDLRRQRKSLPV